MAEIRNPAQQNGDGSRLLLVVMILFVCIFLGVREFSTTGARATLRQQNVVVPASPSSMNIVERQLFVPLAFIQGHVVTGRDGSWGWAIVLITVGINLLLLPLRISSMRSGVKMQRLQPAIQGIKARYKNVKLTDPRHSEMAAEIAKLQKANGVNMFGGCLPLLIQMPLLFAFFGMLRKAAPLHGATWLWLHDLSAADPYHVLPIFMTISQLLVQWYTPSPGSDMQQQRVMACIMTVVFGYVSWHYASGLALYALTGSLFSLATQVAMNLWGSIR